MNLTPNMLETLKAMKNTRGVGADLGKHTTKALLSRGLIVMVEAGKTEPHGRRGSIAVSPAIYALTDKGIAACL